MSGVWKGSTPLKWTVGLDIAQGTLSVAEALRPHGSGAFAGVACKRPGTITSSAPPRLINPQFETLKLWMAATFGQAPGCGHCPATTQSNQSMSSGGESEGNR